jgi:Ran GTPase-activating protein (RanGAP) involved in mRNA processing and transport
MPLAHTMESLQTQVLTDKQEREVVYKVVQFCNQNDIDDALVRSFVENNQDIKRLKRLTTTANDLDTINDFNLMQSPDLSKIKPSKLLNLIKIASYTPNLTHLKCFLTDDIDNPLEVVKSLDVLKKLPNLEELTLINLPVSDDGMQIIADNLSYLPNLKVLCINNALIGDPGAQTLANSLKYIKNLKGLFLSDNCIGATGAKDLAQKFAFVEGLERFSLENNKIGDSGAQALANNLQSIKDLKNLVLSNNQISFEGIQALANNLQYVKKLERLSLGQNQIGNNGLQELANNLQYVNSLEMLFLSDSNIEDAGIQVLASFLQQSQIVPVLSFLELRGNNIAQQGGNALTSIYNNDTREQLVISGLSIDVPVNNANF